jgi:osmotically-inducible protein OsmY
VSETPERIEREMFEIRSRMSSDMTDLRKHIEPQAVAEQVKQTVRQRLREAVGRLQANLKAKQQELVSSTKRQLSLARKAGEAGENRDTTPLTDAVKSDPRPLVILAILLVVTLLMARKITGNRGDQE